MKELSIEEKAKAYDEVVARIRHAFNSNRCTLGFMNEVLRYPRESEDERIRKSLLRWLQSNSYTSIAGIQINDVIAWLEKQGTSYTKKDVDNAYIEGMAFAKDELEKQSKEDSSIQQAYEWGYTEGKRIERKHWIEKQGEQKLPIEKLPEEMKSIGESLGFTTQKECDEYNQMVSGLIMSDEEDYNNIDPHFGKPINKIEPKFKVGDWILYSGDHYEGVRHITKIDENGYYIKRNGLPHSIIPFNHEICMRLWTIQDAKDGDVLKEDSCTFIIERMKPNGTAIIHCCLFDDGDFDLGSTLSFDVDSTYPATKEQRDLLFQKMNEAGYEWDAKKKELKKIDTELTNFEKSLKHVMEETLECGDMRNLKADADLLLRLAKPTEIVKWSAQEEYCICELEAMVKEAWGKAESVHNNVTIKKMQELMFFLKTLNPNKKPQRIISAEAKEAMYDSPAWNKEDEITCETLIDIVNIYYKDCFGKIEKNLLLNWIKLLKDRVQLQPKQEWSEEDERLLSKLQTYVDLECFDRECNGQNLIDWLKSLRSQNTWKPSDEQMRALDSTLQYSQVSHNSYEHLNSLYDDLKKLKGE